MSALELEDRSEAALYAPIILAASEAGHRLFRNHVGMAKHVSRSRVTNIRHGLPPGSGDLIGLTRDGRFASIEVKPPGWRPTPSYLKSEYGRRQVAWRDTVVRMGGVAGFATSVVDALGILEG